jgi:SurA N-terminal domain
MKRRTISLAIIILAVPFLFFACKKTDKAGANVSQATPEQQQKMELLKKSFDESQKVIAAKVNEEPISQFFVVREMNTLVPQYLTPGQQITPELSQKIHAIALNGLIFKELVVQEAKKKGMKVDPQAIENELKNFKSKTGSEAAYQEYLSNNGFTEESFRNMIEKDYLYQTVLAHEIYAKITVSDEMLRKRYQQEKSQFMPKDAKHRQVTFDEMKEILEQKIKAEKGEEKIREMDKFLRNNAHIEIIEQKPKQG